MAVVWMVKEICVGENTSRDTSETAKTARLVDIIPHFSFVIIEL